VPQTLALQCPVFWRQPPGNPIQGHRQRRIWGVWISGFHWFWAYFLGFYHRNVFIWGLNPENPTKCAHGKIRHHTCWGWENEVANILYPRPVFPLESRKEDVHFVPVYSFARSSKLTAIPKCGRSGDFSRHLTLRITFTRLYYSTVSHGWVSIFMTKTKKVKNIITSLYKTAI